MTTKPKARKFRIRRTDGAGPGGDSRATGTDGAPDAAASAAAAAASMRTAAADTSAEQAPRRAAAAPDAPKDVTPEDTSLPNKTEDGFGDMALPGSAAADRARSAPQGSAPQSAEAELAAIRSEGLTGRQLRMARRAAQKHGLSPSSDFDAVRQLRMRGIDPFGQSNMLELVVNEAQKGADAGAAGGNTLPVRAATAQVPATQVAPQPPAGITHTPESRASEIMNVQRDIANRRRRKLIQLATRLALFVFLPTMLVSYYYYAVATPLYATNTEFVIQKAESSAGGSGLGGLLGGTSFATVQESITVQSYLESREAMLRLDEELNFREHFSGEDIDPLVRLAPDASDEQMYSTYLRNLTIGYDPTEGLIRMEVLAADPAVSQAFSEALITYAEERVDQMSSRLREDQMAGAREGFQEAEERSLQAQMRVLELQEQRGVLSAEAEVNQVFSQIAAFEMQLAEERLRLAEINAASRPNATRVQVAEANIARYEAVIAGLRASLTEEAQGEVSLARIQSELVIAQADLETRQLMLTEALQAMESARSEANRQSLYISMGVFPVAPDEAAYPKAFEKTLLALIVFSGIYLLISMTASILREQVSS
ncbi:capsule biosynthesis protein [Gymnodinialimonas ceratoperidinii]|uniref:Capsule biosynthesis protein n=1 Tax=Gymnodinialimonas ceratoperidinii TaxID=2856823 RepID=A0A8F6YDT6_9RHOB|nr:capsule biosynthesis protein [Gymnodinialimonas ceratoperidinii]QXT40537.1 capsule biosynthesis protein [Gymnodinialimonas ceratoperidinii]